jgi:maleate cis-trans isomerase
MKHLIGMIYPAAALMALNHFGAMRITLLTAYSDEITRLEAEFLRDNGFEVLSAVGAGIDDPLRSS